MVRAAVPETLASHHQLARAPECYYAPRRLPSFIHGPGSRHYHHYAPDALRLLPCAARPRIVIPNRSNKKRSGGTVFGHAALR